LVNAQSVFRRPTDHGFGVNGPGKMAVEITALGHLPEEGVKTPWLIPDGFHEKSSLLLCCPVFMIIRKDWQVHSRHSAKQKNDQGKPGKQFRQI
jgi:hypothetical protein